MVLNVLPSYPHTQTYVLKLHRDAAPGEGLISGSLEHVASGHQFHFHSVGELLACLASKAAYADASSETGSQEDAR